MKYSLSKILDSVHIDLDVRSIYQANQELIIILEHREVRPAHKKDLYPRREELYAPFRLYRKDPYSRGEELYIELPDSDTLNVTYYLIESPETIRRMENHCEARQRFINNTPVNFIACEDAIKIPQEALCLYAHPGLGLNAHCTSNTIIKGAREMPSIEFNQCFFNDIKSRFDEMDTSKSLTTTKPITTTNYPFILGAVMCFTALFMIKKFCASFTNKAKVLINVDIKKTDAINDDDIENNAPRYSM